MIFKRFRSSGPIITAASSEPQPTSLHPRTLLCHIKDVPGGQAPQLSRVGGRGTECVQVSREVGVSLGSCVGGWMSLQ